MDAAIVPSRAGYRTAALGILALTVLAFVFALPGSLSLLFLLAPGYWFTCRLTDEEWERWALTPIFAFILSSFLSYALAVADAYRPALAGALITALNVAAGIDFVRRPLPSVPSDRSPLPPSDRTVLVAALVPLGLLYFYGGLCYVAGFNNGLLPGYGQMGLFIMRSGSFHLLTPAESCYNNSAFLYMPGYPGLIAWMASVASFEGLRRALGFVAPFMMVSGFATLLALGHRRGWRLSTALFTLLVMLPSYALFKISYEVESDNPAVPLTAAFLYLMARLTGPGPRRADAARWMGVMLLWAFSWWVRPYLGIFLSFTLGVLLLSSEARRSLGALFKEGWWPWARPFRFTAVLALLLWGPFWEALLWVHTGSPLAPRSIAVGPIDLTVKPEFAYYTPQVRPAPKDTPPAAPDPEDRAGLALIAYHFFPVSWSGAPLVDAVKSARALVHGNSFSGLFTLLAVAGLALLLKRRGGGLFSLRGVSLTLLSSLALLVTLLFFHVKIFLSVLPLFFLFAGEAVERLSGRRGGRVAVGVGSIFLSLVFAASFFWSGVGTWPTDRRWALFNAELGTPGAGEWIKNGDTLRPVIDLLKTAPAEERFLYFHPEPGQGLAFDLDHHMFWEDFHYDSQRLAALHRLEKPDQVLRALNALGIRRIVLTYGLERYLSRLEPEVLPRMLLNGHPGLTLEGQTPNGTYRVYRVAPTGGAAGTAERASKTAMPMGSVGVAKS